MSPVRVCQHAGSPRFWWLYFQRSPCPMKLGTMRKAREVIEISLGRLRDVEKERLIAHLGEMVVSCAFGVLPVVTIE